ncbi:hypothetical protein F5X98DRAFT_380446 [Xylaria grammica]|nr:hypothetical protein F5X98DRAFT_380446 [Xylaria grammica]
MSPNSSLQPYSPRSKKEAQLLWVELVARQRRKLDDHKHRHLLPKLANYDSFNQCIDSMLNDYTAKPSQKALAKMRPLLRFFNQYTSALNILAQTNDATSFIWGLMQVAITLASKHEKELYMISSQMAEMMRQMEIIEEHIDLFPGNRQLHNPLRVLYEAYTNFCISVMKYLSKSSLSRLVGSALGAHEEVFEDSRSTIKRCLQDFDKTTTLVARKEQITRIREIHSRVAQSTDSIGKASSLIDGLKPHNEFFIGRDDVLIQVHKHLQCSQGEASQTTRKDIKICVIHAMSGMGKTLLASEYAHKYMDQFDCIFMLRSQNVTELRQDFAAIYRKVSNASENEKTDQRRNIELARAWLSSTGTHGLRWLLIFDNVVDINHIRNIWPTTGPGSIILTTQKSNISDIAKNSQKNIFLKPLSSNDGVDLLMSYLNNAERKGYDWANTHLARQICDFVGDLPLSIAHIAGSLTSAGHSLASFLAALRERQKSKKMWSSRLENTFQVEERHEILANVNDIILSDLQKEDVNAQRLLNVMAFLSADTIPGELMLASTEVETVYLEDCGDRFNLLNVAQGLNKRNLAQTSSSPTGEAFSLHRSLQQDVLHRLDEEPKELQSAFDATSSLLRSVFEKYVPHVLALHRAYAGSGPGLKGSIQFASLLSDIGMFLWERMLGEDGVPSLRTALQILERSEFSGREVDVMRSDIHVVLGILYCFQGLSSRKDEIMHRQRAKELREKLHLELDPMKVTREDEIRLYNSRSDIAFGMVSEDKFESAHNIMKGCLEKYRQWGNEDDVPFEYAKYYYIASFDHLRKGNIEVAVRSIQHATSLQAKELKNASSFMVSQYKFMTACCIMFIGDKEAALNLHNEVRKHRMDLMGEFDLRTMNSTYMVAAVKSTMGQDEIESAKQLLRSLVNSSAVTTWIEECGARTRFLLGTLTKNDPGQGQDSDALLSRANDVLQKNMSLIPDWVKEAAVNGGNDMFLYDHLCPNSMGCTTGFWEAPAEEREDGSN